MENIPTEALKNELGKRQMSENFKQDCEVLQKAICNLTGEVYWPYLKPGTDWKNKRDELSAYLEELRSNVTKEEQRRTSLTSEQRQEEDDCFEFFESDSYRQACECLSFLDYESEQECYQPCSKKEAPDCFKALKNRILEIKDNCQSALYIIKNYKNN